MRTREKSRKTRKETSSSMFEDSENKIKRTLKDTMTTGAIEAKDSDKNESREPNVPTCVSHNVTTTTKSQCYAPNVMYPMLYTQCVISEITLHLLLQRSESISLELLY